MQTRMQTQMQTLQAMEQMVQLADTVSQLDPHGHDDSIHEAVENLQLLGETADPHGAQHQYAADEAAVYARLTQRFGAAAVAAARGAARQRYTRIAKRVGGGGSRRSRSSGRGRRYDDRGYGVDRDFDRDRHKVESSFAKAMNGLKMVAGMSTRMAIWTIKGIGKTLWKVIHWWLWLLYRPFTAAAEAVVAGVAGAINLLRKHWGKILIALGVLGVFLYGAFIFRNNKTNTMLGSPQDLAEWIFGKEINEGNSKTFMQGVDLDKIISRHFFFIVSFFP